MRMTAMKSTQQVKQNMNVASHWNGLSDGTDRTESLFLLVNTSLYIWHHCKVIDEEFFSSVAGIHSPPV